MKQSLRIWVEGIVPPSTPSPSNLVIGLLMMQWQGLWIHGMVFSGRAPGSWDLQKLKFWASVTGTLKTWLGTERFWGTRYPISFSSVLPLSWLRAAQATGPDQVLESPRSLVTTPSFTSGFQHLTPFMVSWIGFGSSCCYLSPSLRELPPRAKIVAKQVVNPLGKYAK